MQKMGAVEAAAKFASSKKLIVVGNKGKGLKELETARLLYGDNDASP